MNSGIYSITNLVNGKRYVGSSANLKKRISVHKWALNRGIHDNSYLQRAWKKYGEKNFRFDILEYVGEECLLTVEQYYLDWLEVCKEEFGYNLSPVSTSCLGIKRSDVTKEKMRIAKIGKVFTEEHKQKIGEANRGKKHTTESKKKMSILHSGENGSKAKLTWGKVRQIREKYASGQFFQKELGIMFGVDDSVICRIVTNKIWITKE